MSRSILKSPAQKKISKWLISIGKHNGISARLVSFLFLFQLGLNTELPFLTLRSGHELRSRVGCLTVGAPSCPQKWFLCSLLSSPWVTLGSFVIFLRFFCCSSSFSHQEKDNIWVIRYFLVLSKIIGIVYGNCTFCKEYIWPWILLYTFLKVQRHNWQRRDKVF